MRGFFGNSENCFNIIHGREAGKQIISSCSALSRIFLSLKQVTISIVPKGVLKMLILTFRGKSAAQCQSLGKNLVFLK